MKMPVMKTADGIILYYTENGFETTNKLAIISALIHDDCQQAKEILSAIMVQTNWIKVN